MFSLKSLQKNKTIRYGVPMILLVVGGSFGLREFSQIRYDAHKLNKRLDPSLEAKLNVRNPTVVMEEEYEKMKQVNLGKWRNIRGPRPWEDSREYQEQQHSRQRETD